MVINHPLSASSICDDRGHPLCSIYMPDSLFQQSLSKFSLATSWPCTLHFILHTFLHPIIVFFSQHMPIPSQLTELTVHFILLIIHTPCYFHLLSISPCASGLTGFPLNYNPFMWSFESTIPHAATSHLLDASCVFHALALLYIIQSAQHYLRVPHDQAVSVYLSWLELARDHLYILCTIHVYPL